VPPSAHSIPPSIQICQRSFFEPFQLHFEAADLLEQLGLDGLGLGGGRLGGRAEDSLGAFR
jgi:hypothetical protein